MDSTTDTVRPTTTQHEELGRAARMRPPRSSLCAWEAPANRADPVDLLLGQASTSDPSPIPLRHARMGVSPLTFFRGTALVMARDLAALPDTGLDTQLCSDAHLSNFGLFASEDRRTRSSGSAAWACTPGSSCSKGSDRKTCSCSSSRRHSDR
ncbi:DUF2252 family protein [Cryobacterium sp. GrIS_2_6]|uniref:DUF2252 family protein n=1 Tax=Cryobacterium sp. GrIS_2_6 TaxID=3162785 RepID=UPI002E12E933